MTGQWINVGPAGKREQREYSIYSPRFLFCATGTGVSPFHCFAGAMPGRLTPALQEEPNIFAEVYF